MARISCTSVLAHYELLLKKGKPFYIYNLVVEDEQYEDLSITDDVYTIDEVIKKLDEKWRGEKEKRGERARFIARLTHEILLKAYMV